MDTTSMRRAGALIHLAQSHFPRDVESDGEFGDWKIVAPALVSIASSLLEGIFQSPPPNHVVNADIQFRSLTDYAITFAWIAAAEDDEDRAERLRRFVGSELEWREKANNRLLDQMRDHPSGRYRELLSRYGLSNGL